MNKYNFDNFQPKAGHLITHVGLIADGTRRYARREKIFLYDAYIQSMKKIVQYIALFFEMRIQIISIYLSSDKNFKRSLTEIKAFCEAETELCKEILPPIASKYKACVRIVGRKELIPQYLKEAIEGIELQTKRNEKNTINLLFAYNPFTEILEAFRNSPSVEQFLNYLAVSEPLDLVIRTSGPNLLSNFLPLQCAYARLYVIDKLFNDTDANDIMDILVSFKKLNRLYGV